METSTDAALPSMAHLELQERRGGHGLAVQVVRSDSEVPE